MFARAIFVIPKIVRPDTKSAEGQKAKNEKMNNPVRMPAEFAATSLTSHVRPM